MTAGGILDAALALLFETRQSAADYARFAPQVLNNILPGLLGVNNQLRELAGKEPLPAAPEIMTLDSEVGFEPDLERAVLPWGLAGNLLLADEEQGRAVNYLSQYTAAVENLTRLLPRPVEDVY